MADAQVEAEGTTYPRPPEEAKAEASVGGELDPVVNTDNSQIHHTLTPSKQLKEEEKKGEEPKEQKKREETKEEKKGEEPKEEKKNGQQNLNSGLIITGVVVAVIGAMFAIFKNIKKA